MEEKKTARVDLEKNRSLYVLMALAVVLSFFFVLMEWKQTQDFSDFAPAPQPIEEEFTTSAPDWLLPSPPQLGIEIQPVLPTILYKGFDIKDDTVDIVFPSDEIPELSPIGEKIQSVIISDSDVPLSLSGERVSTNDMPEYPGGLIELKRFIYHAIHYPAEAVPLGIEGRVICSFIINKNGSVSDIRIEKSIHPLLDTETLRVIHLIPSWKPGNPPKQVKYIIPITFRL